MRKKKNAIIEIGSVALGFALIIGNLIKDALDKREQEEYIDERIEERINTLMAERTEDEEKSEEDTESEEDEEL